MLLGVTKLKKNR